MKHHKHIYSFIYSLFPDYKLKTYGFSGEGLMRDKPKRCKLYFTCWIIVGNSGVTIPRLIVVTTITIIYFLSSSCFSKRALPRCLQDNRKCPAAQWWKMGQVLVRLRGKNQKWAFVTWLRCRAETQRETEGEFGVLSTLMITVTSRWREEQNISKQMNIYGGPQ